MRFKGPSWAYVPARASRSAAGSLRMPIFLAWSTWPETPAAARAIRRSIGTSRASRFQSSRRVAKSSGVDAEAIASSRDLRCTYVSWPSAKCRPCAASSAPDRNWVRSRLQIASDSTCHLPMVSAPPGTQKTPPAPTTDDDWLAAHSLSRTARSSSGIPLARMKTQRSCMACARACSVYALAKSRRPPPPNELSIATTSRAAETREVQTVSRRAGATGWGLGGRVCERAAGNSRSTAITAAEDRFACVLAQRPHPPSRSPGRAYTSSAGTRRSCRVPGK